MATFKPLEARHRMKELLAAHFHGLDEAARDPDRKVAWCTSVGPAELLHSFGFEVYYPENHGALLGASRKANDYIPRANAAGYSPEICSYLTADVGAFLAGETPLTGAYGLESVPTPDVLVYNTNQCRDVQDWFGFYARHFKVPLIGIQSPMQVGEVTDNMVESLVPQYRALIPTLEEVSGRRFDPDRLAEIMTLATRTTHLWEQVLGTMQQRPSPLTFFDTTIHMAPAVVLRGLPEAVDYYEQLLAELEERSGQGMAAVDGERFRLYWDGMPVWGRLRELSTFFQQLQASIVVSTYCNSWVFAAFDPKQPFKSMARAYLELFIARSDPAKEAVMADLCQEFSVDGVIYHDAKTCPNNSNTRYGLPQRLRKRTGLPFTIVYGDLNDLRCFSEEQAKTSVEAFLEQLEAGAPQMSAGYTCGVDIGSTWTKVVLLDTAGEVVARGLARTAMSFEQAAEAARAQALAKAGIAAEQVASTVATGYGRKNAGFADRDRTEIACHARGAFHHHPRACHVVDIGGQDNKVIHLLDDGSVEQFQMNRKCAAGTGAFVEEIARRLDLDLADLERLAEGADRDITLASFCTVFSATEVIKLIREGESPENICKGIFNSVVARVAEMGQLGDRVVLTGGVAAAFPVVAKILTDRTGAHVTVPPHAQFIGALGAALEANSLAA